MITILRWILLPAACFIAWSLAIVLGIILLNVAESFCPPEEMISCCCTAPWFPAVQTSIFYFSTAISAVFVVVTAYLSAPAERVHVIWIAFCFGCIAATYFVVITAAFGVFAVTVTAGLFTAIALTEFACGE